MILISGILIGRKTRVNTKCTI